MQITTPPGLYKQVLETIGREQQLISVRRKLRLYFFALTGATVAAVSTVVYFLEQISHTGFAQIGGLIFSDFGFISGHLGVYTLSLFETLPVISFAVLSVVLLLSLLAAINFCRYALRLRSLRLMIN